MENEKLECAKVFVYLLDEEDKKRQVTFLVEKEKAEKMYIFAERVCQKEHINYDMVGFGITKYDPKEEYLVNEKYIYATLTGKTYQQEEEQSL